MISERVFLPKLPLRSCSGESVLVWVLPRDRDRAVRIQDESDHDELNQGRPGRSVTECRHPFPDAAMSQVP